MPATLDAAAFQGPIAVTAAYFGVWYGLLLGLQRGTKYKLLAEYAARGEQFDRYFGQDGRMLAADRAVANTHEQMVPFLTGLWLHALFVSPARATYLGAAYVTLRAIYPVLLGRSLSRTQSKRVAFATMPAYAIVFYLIGSVVLAAVSAD
ncbi:MAG: MAPEG family protein [Myxococcales bacterium]|nr:MAPEG family protein [Myxococcales bacterium]